MNMSRTTTRYSTWPGHGSSAESRLDHVRKQAVTVQGLRDPLGAKGFRVTRHRIAREGQARRLAAVAAIGSFVAAFGLLVRAAPDSRPMTADPAPAVVTSPALITGATIPHGGSGAAVIRLEPTAVPRTSHTTSRSS